MRKKEKRERKKKDKGIIDFMMVIHHFFQSLNDWISEMEDITMGFKGSRTQVFHQLNP